MSDCPEHNCQLGKHHKDVEHVMYYYGTTIPMLWWKDGRWRMDQGTGGTYSSKSLFKKNSSGP